MIILSTVRLLYLLQDLWVFHHVILLDVDSNAILDQDNHGKIIKGTVYKWQSLSCCRSHQLVTSWNNHVTSLPISSGGRGRYQLVATVGSETPLVSVIPVNHQWLAPCRKWNFPRVSRSSQPSVTGYSGKWNSHCLSHSCQPPVTGHTRKWNSPHVSHQWLVPVGSETFLMSVIPVSHPWLVPAGNETLHVTVLPVSQPWLAPVGSL